MTAGPILRRILDRARLFFPYFEPDMLAIKSREKRFTLPRQYVWYMLRAHGMSYPWIAKHTGGWDHTTILHGVKMHAARLMNGKFSLNKKAIEMHDTTKIYSEIESLREQLMQIDQQLDELNRKKRTNTYRLNDIVELMYRTVDMDGPNGTEETNEQGEASVQDLEGNRIRTSTLPSG